MTNTSTLHYTPKPTKENKAVAVWLSIGVVMLLVQILLGALPPLSEQDWQQSFEKYQHIAQFRKVNSDFTLSDYKSIFFWEWFHREWARLMGLVFVIPFVTFIIQKKINQKMIGPLAILFLLGGLQGAIGWIMVQSGLNDTDIRVSHIRLAVHFMCALYLLTYLLWFTLKQSIPASRWHYTSGLKTLTSILLVLLFFQLIYGAFMAGSHAALSAPSWPDINGAYIPQSLVSRGSAVHDLCYNPVTIQFIHRTLAYFIFITMLVWFFNATQQDHRSWIYRYRYVPLLLVFMQIALGILALINSMFKNAIYFSVLHQLVGIVLLCTVVTMLFVSRQKAVYRG